MQNAHLLIIDWKLDTIFWILRIFIAAVCGFFIGYERKTPSKEAGVRTHTIVAMGTAMLMILSKYGFEDSQGRFDGARIAAQVVSGIGFLGAGIIIYRRDVLQGVTTAAGVWTTAGIGMAIGAGMIIVGIVSTVFLIMSQVILHIPFKILRGRVFSVIKAQIEIVDENTITHFKKLFQIRRFVKFKSYMVGETCMADIELSTQYGYTAEELYAILHNNFYIKSIEKTEDI